MICEETELLLAEMIRNVVWTFRSLKTIRYDDQTNVLVLQYD